jgi:glycosyltransferase involved in cell wall biosynthesis
MSSQPNKRSENLRIAMVAACPFPANRGTPSRILRMAEAMADRGHEVHVVTYHFGTGTPTRGIHIHRVPKVGKSYFGPGPTYSKLLLYDPLLTLLLRKVLREHCIDLIHAHHFEGALVALAARGWRNFPIIYDAHTTLSGELNKYRFRVPRFLKNLFARHLDEFVPRNCEHVVAVSETLKDSLVQLRIPYERISVVPTGVNLEEFEGDAGEPLVTGRYGITTEKVVVYAGSTAAFQGVTYLLEAIPYVLQEEPDTMVFIVGEENSALSGICKAKAIADHVIVTGEQPFEKVRNFLAHARVAVIPRPECPGIPQKLTNYMAAGCAIVSFQGSAKLLTHEVNGIVIPDDNFQIMAEAIVRLLRNKELADSLGENARQSVAEYDWHCLAERIEKIYRDFVK